MSYIKIDFGGVERTLKFAQMALHMMPKYVNHEYPELTSGYALVYAGLSCYEYQVNRKPLDLTFEQVCDMVDKLNGEQILAIKKAYEEEFNFEKEPEKEDVKKKKARVSRNT